MAHRVGQTRDSNSEAGGGVEAERGRSKKEPAVTSRVL